MYPNINAGIGAVMASGLTSNPSFGSGRIFIVVADSNNSANELKAMYGAGYPDGTPIIYTTITGALGAAVSGRGDIIFVAPQHAENITAAASIAVSKTGVRIIGLGSGRERPTLTWTTATTAQITITGANDSFENFIFDMTGFGAVVAGFSVTAADTTFKNCEFILSTGTNAPVLGILTAATAARLKVEGCRFIGPAVSTQTCTAAIKHEVGIDYVIQNNEFRGKLTQAILNATAILGGLIKDNTFVISTGTVAITMHTSSTPFITNNRINVPSGTAPIVAAAGFVAGNVYSAAAGVTAGTASTI